MAQAIEQEALCTEVVFEVNAGETSFPGGSEGKESAYNAGDAGLIPGSGRVPWRREWQPTLVLYSCLENQAPVHGVAKNWPQLSDFTGETGGTG